LFGTLLESSNFASRPSKAGGLPDDYYGRNHHKICPRASFQIYNAGRQSKALIHIPGRTFLALHYQSDIFFIAFLVFFF
jgi:hypothetical protein